MSDAEDGGDGGVAERKAPPPIPESARTDKHSQWYFKGYVVVIAVLKAGPFALPLVWCHPRLPLWGKLVATVASVLYAWGVVVAIIWMWRHTMEQLELLKTTIQGM